jgi:hypothetical protein
MRMQANGYRQLLYLVRIKNRTITTTRDPRLQVGRRRYIEQRPMLLRLLYGSCVHFPLWAV